MMTFFEQRSVRLRFLLSFSTLAIKLHCHQRTIQHSTLVLDQVSKYLFIYLQ